MEGNKNTHRRCRSEGGAGGALAQWDSLQPSLNVQGNNYSGAAELRTVSLDTSASQFLQSLALHDARASNSQLPSFDAQPTAVGQPHCDTAAHAAAAATYAAAQANRDAWLGTAEVTIASGTKRLHDSSKSRGSKDVSQQEGKKDALHQHKHSFTPALPAVEEMTGEDAGLGDRDDDDEDYDSDRDEYTTPASRRSSGSRSRARRGGYNGRSENELLLLDPKRVKRIMANRQSAARSKERRLNYTMQLEGKLQSLSQEVDKLTACLDSLQGQGKGLLQARAELEQQVKALQGQLSQTTSENEALMNELYGLQQSLGLPQVLPQAGAVASYLEGQHPASFTASTAAQVHYDPADVSCGAQEQYRRPQQYVHWQQYNGTAEQCEPPHAAAVEALHVSKSHLQFQEYQLQQQQHSHRGSNSSIGYHSAPEGMEIGRLPSTSAAAAAGTVAGLGMPPLPPIGKPAGGQVAGAAIAKTGSGGFPGQPASPRVPSPQAIAAAAPPAISPAVTAAAAASALSSDAAAAADALLLDASVGVADDAAMTNADDLELLSVLFEDTPMQDHPGSASTAAERQQTSSVLDFSNHQQKQPMQVGSIPATPLAAAIQPANMQPYQSSTDQPGLLRSANVAAAAAASAPAPAAHYPGSLPAYRRPAALTTVGPSNSNSNLPQQGSALTPGHSRTWSAHSSPGTAAGNTSLGFDRPASGTANPNVPFHPISSNSGVLNPYTRGLRSPAFSDPLAEGYPDDVSSGSLGGCLTPGTRQHRMSEESSMAAAGALRQQGPPAARSWQQQQQMLPAVSPPTPGAERSAADAGPLGSHHLGVAALMPPAAHAAAPAAPTTMAQYKGPTSYQVQQQQQQATPGDYASSTAAAAALLDTAQVNFTMGVNPAAGHRRSASYGAPASHHHRSASAGSMTGMSWAELAAAAAAADRSGMHWSLQSYGSHAGSMGGVGLSGELTAGSGMRPAASPLHHQQQQQQYITGGNMAAAGAGYYRAGRLSAPGYPVQGSVPADATLNAAATGPEHWPHVTGNVQGSIDSSRLQQHRRSYSHAGTYTGEPFAVDVSGNYEQQVDRIHPAALVPGAAAAASMTPGQAASLTMFGGYHGGPGGSLGADVHDTLDMHTRIVTTSNHLGQSR